MLDLPGIIEGAAQGKGRGRQVIAVARTADLVLMILDATKKDVHRQLLEAELDSVGIRLNQRPPNIYFKARMTADCSNIQFDNVPLCAQVKTAGGIKFNSTVTLSRIDEKLVQMILHEYKIFNAEVPSSFDAQ